jgi:hypothetical protein
MSKILKPHFNYYRNKAHYEYLVVYKGKVSTTFIIES